MSTSMALAVVGSMFVLAGMHKPWERFTVGCILLCLAAALKVV